MKKTFFILLLLLLAVSVWALEPEGHTRVRRTPAVFMSTAKPTDWRKFQLSFSIVPGEGAAPETLVDFGAVRLEMDRGNFMSVQIGHENAEPTVLRAHRPLRRGVLSNVVFQRGQWLAGGIPDAYALYFDGYLVAAMPVYVAPSGKPSVNPVVKSPTGGELSDFQCGTHDGTIVPCADVVRLEPDFSKGWTGVYHDAVCAADGLVLKTEEVATEEVLSGFFSVDERKTYVLSGQEKVVSFADGVSALSVWVRYYFEPEETCSFGGDQLLECRKAGESHDWRAFAAEFTVPHWERATRPLRYARIQAKIYRAKAESGLKDLQLKRKGGK